MAHYLNQLRLATLILCISISVSGCLTGGSSPAAAVSANQPATTNLPNGANTPPAASSTKPTISGAPALSVTVGNSYRFNPKATDADNDELTFSVKNLPGWASFNKSTGAITGKPGIGDTGKYTGIVITVSDGENRVALPGFGIVVEQSGQFSVTLSWRPPTADADGTPLRDLDGYTIYYGTQPGRNYSNTVTVRNEGVTRYVIENLAAGNYYFAISAYDKNGNESNLSPEAGVRIG